MANQELVEYIKHQFAEGKGQDEVKALLLSHGWKEEDVTHAFAVVSGVPMPPSSNVPSTEPLPAAGELLKEAWNLLSQRFNVFLGIMVVPAVFALAFVALSMSGVKVSSHETESSLGGVVIFVFILLYFIAQVWSQLAAVHAVAGSDEQIGFKESFRRAYHGVGSYLWLSILSGLVIMGGFMLFVVPGIIMAISFSFATYVFVTEGVKGMAALIRSRDYVKGKWGAIFWRQLFIGIVCAIIIFIPQLIFQILGKPDIASVVNALTAIVAIPLGLIYTFLLFKKVKAAKGEIVSTPTGGQKAKYWVIAILGPMFIVAIILILSVNLDFAP